MAKRTRKRAGSAKSSFFQARPRVRDRDGESVTLKWNEPRPDLAVKAIASVQVARRGLGLAGVRLEAETILQSGCGERDVIERLRRLGPEVAGVLVKIAASGAECSCGGACADSAIGALGFFPTAESFDCLIRIADDARADPGARAKSVAALGRIGTPSCVDYLLGVLTGARDPDLRRAAARGLGYSRSATALERLMIVVKKDRNLLVRQMAYGAVQAIAGANRLQVPKLTPPPSPRLARPTKANPPKEAQR
jgi:hypothetical protein